MKHLAAYSLLVLAGNAAPSKLARHLIPNTLSIYTILIMPFHILAADQVEKLLKDVGVTANKEDLAAMIKALSGKKLHDLVRDGSKKLASVPSGVAASGKTTKSPLHIYLIFCVCDRSRSGCPRCRRCCQEGGEAQGRRSR